MKNLILILLYPLFFISCSDSFESNTKKNEKFQNTWSHVVSIIDTARKYENLHDLFLCIDKQGTLTDYYYQGTINNSKFAIDIEIEFGNIIIYQKNDSDWIITDTIESHSDDDNYHRMDVNFDGFDDLIIGENKYQALVYDSKQNLLFSDSNYNLPKFSIDAKNKIFRTIDTTYEGEKQRWKWLNGKLKPIDRVVLNYGLDHDDGHSIDTLKYYKTVNGKEHLAIVKIDRHEIIKELFDKKLWETK